MPNLLGVTNSVPNYDNTNSSRPVPTSPRPENSQIQNLADPNRVVRPDGRTEQQGAGNPLASNGLRYDSNLQVFLQRLRNMPELTEEISKTMALLQGMISTPGLEAGVAEELGRLLQMFQMDAAQFRAFFLAQLQSANRFSGPLFDMLRQAYQRAGGTNLQEAILNFAKKYADFSSTGHIGRHMLQLLDQLQARLPQSWRGQLSELLAALENSLNAGDRAGGLQLLQGSILPYLGSYIGRYHDMGEARTLLSMLMLDVARYENGAEEGLLLAFRQLGQYGPPLSNLNKLDDSLVWQLLRENSFTAAVKADQFAEQMARTASQALNGRYGTDMREAFQEIVRAMMVNESVYMPLRHMMIPVEYEGKKLYSEFWVDPDAEEKKENGSGERKIQFLFKMDIGSLGFLEMTLAARGDQVELDVYGPKSMVGSSSLIAEDLKDILKSHGFTGKNVRVMEEKRPLTLTEVFPDLLEGKRSINVKI